MIPVKQTILHSDEANGNCFAAVIASLLETTIDKIIPIHEIFDTPTWADKLFANLFEQGLLWRSAPEFKYAYHLRDHNDIIYYFPHELKKRLADKFYIVIGKTQRSPVYHTCIYKNGKLVHDPHPDNTGLTTTEWFEVIEPHRIAKRVLNNMFDGKKYNSFHMDELWLYSHSQDLLQKKTNK